MTPAIGYVLIIVGLLDGAAMWFLILPRLPAKNRTAVVVAIAASTLLLIGLGVGTILGMGPG